MKCFLVERVEVDGGLEWREVDGQRRWSYLKDVPAGAVWEANWMGDSFRVNGDGPVLVVKLPDGRDWMPGSRAANCTRPDEDHDCWCVHGEPPDLTVDKIPVPGRSTCNAGAGSIGPAGGGPGWHGFLRSGQLVVA